MAGLGFFSHFGTARGTKTRPWPRPARGCRGATGGQADARILAGRYCGTRAHKLSAETLRWGTHKPRSQGRIGLDQVRDGRQAAWGTRVLSMKGVYRRLVRRPSE